MKRIFWTICFGTIVLLSSAENSTHVVKKGETLYSLSKQYHTSVEQLAKANGLNSNSGLRIGQSLVIPGKTSTPVQVPPSLQAKPVPAKVHTVTKGETIYSVSKKYGVTVTEIKQWNKLADANLRIGQKLVVSKANSLAMYNSISVPSTPDTPYREEDQRIRFQQQVMEPEPEANDNTVVAKTEPVKQVTTNSNPGLRVSTANPVEYPVYFNNYPASGFKIKKERGAANYLMDETSGNQFLAFYNDAEVGSVIRVTNMLNQKTVYVKVIGKVPALDAQAEVMLKLSNKAAEELGANDSKFLVEVASYN